MRIKGEAKSALPSACGKGNSCGQERRAASDLVDRRRPKGRRADGNPSHQAVTTALPNLNTKHRMHIASATEESASEETPFRIAGGGDGAKGEDNRVR